MSEAPRVIIAIRVSTERQISEGYGHENQRAFLPELVEKQGWVLCKRPDGRDAIYDEGFASTTASDPNGTSLDDRPVMQALLQELDYTKPTYLVCRQLDRLRRDMYEHAYIVKKLKAAGVRGFAEAPDLRSLVVRDITDTRDEAMVAVQAVFDNLAKADLKIKLMGGRRTHARDGKPNGGPAPYGYHRPVKKAPFQIHEEEAAIYRTMVSLVLDKQWGPAKIAHELILQGRPTRAGTPTWTATTVRRILMNKSQCGYIRAKFSGDEPGTDPWVKAVGQPPIISEEEWARMRAILDSRTRASGHNQRRHALAGLLRCGACGKSLKANPDKRRADGSTKYINYSCRVYNSGCTAGYSISEAKALRELGAWMDALLAATDTAGWRDDLALAAPDIGPLEDRLASLSSELEKAERRRDRAYSAFIDADDADAAVARAEYERRRDRVQELTEQREEARAAYGAAMTVEADGALSTDELRVILAGWRDFPKNEQRMALSAVIDHAILGPRDASPRLTVVPASGLV